MIASLPPLVLSFLMSAVILGFMVGLVAYVTLLERKFAARMQSRVGPYRVGPHGLFQPIAADDVAAIVADVALAAPRNGIVEIAGPERAPFNEIVARYLKAIGDPHTVVSNPEARYFGGRVEERSLVPLGEARLGRIGLDEWLRRSQAGT